MKMINGYNHQIAFHCESGSVRNLLAFNKLNISEAMIFGIGTGVVFAYLINTKAISGFPVVAIRLPMGTIVKNTEKLLGIKFFKKKFKTAEDGIKMVKELIDKNIPSALCVDMFYMKYLPEFMHIHVPFHFIVPVGYDGEDNFYISDAYYQGIGKLKKEYLLAAWETNAKFAMDNFLTFVEEVPEEQNINWKVAIKKSILKTASNMDIPFPINKLLPIFGTNGILFFAKEIIKWPLKHKGLPLREGIMTTATIFEEQGTGGGAFRFLYASFLKESSTKLNNDNLLEASKKMTEIANIWRDASRFLIKVGRQLPIKNEEYDSWIEKNKTFLNDSLNEASKMYIDIANKEALLFKELRKIAQTL